MTTQGEDRGLVGNLLSHEGLPGGSEIQLRLKNPVQQDWEGTVAPTLPEPTVSLEGVGSTTIIYRQFCRPELRI